MVFYLRCKFLPIQVKLKKLKFFTMKKLFLLFMICVSTFVNAKEKQTDNFKKNDEVLSEVVKKAILVAEKTGNFVIEQYPSILQEFYNWHICSSILWIGIALLFLFVCYRIPFFWLTEESESNYDFKYFHKFGEDGATAAWSVFVIACIISATTICINLYDLIFILVAPKLYLIEYFIK